jgi:hypothetical protein
MKKDGNPEALASYLDSVDFLTAQAYDVHIYLHVHSGLVGYTALAPPCRQTTNYQPPTTKLEQRQVRGSHY